MALTSDLISQFVKITKDDKKVQKETTVYATIVYDGKPYAKFDGSDLLTPISTTTNVKDGDRVTVMIKDHTATVTGNISSPSARNEDVDEITGQVTEFGTVVTHKVTADDVQAMNGYFDNIVAVAGKYEELSAVIATIETLKVDIVEGNTLKVDDIEAITAKIESIEGEFGTFTDISTEDLEAVNAEITNLKAYTADFTYLSAVKADIKDLEATKLSAKDADIKFANIDFANIGEAAFLKIFAKSGIIENAVFSDGTFTGRIVGVTIKGDKIEGGTIVAEKLVVLGEDGLYYKLNTNGVTVTAEQTEYNSLNGSIITAKSVTAEKITVDDLVAFGATIGGFHITNRALYSGVKSSVDNSAEGIYLDNEGQLSLGDSNHFLRYYRIDDASSIVSEGVIIVTEKTEGTIEALIESDTLYVSPTISHEVSVKTQIANGVFSVKNDSYKLEISADSILFGSDSKSSASDLKALTEHVKIGTIIDDETGDEKPCVELAEGDSDFKQVITNVKTMFMDGASVTTEIATDGVHTDNVTVDRELRHNNDQNGSFVWAFRSNGNYGLSWKGGTE